MSDVTPDGIWDADSAQRARNWQKPLERDPDPIYVPICATCGKDIHLNDDEKWVHE